ncbi:MAG: TonB-dependent receptor [Granulosicoccus sp.]|nr:TonB-dependent receptor [Granulosicoccus sp.]
MRSCLSNSQTTDDQPLRGFITLPAGILLFTLASVWVSPCLAATPLQATVTTGDSSSSTTVAQGISATQLHTLEAVGGSPLRTGDIIDQGTSASHSRLVRTTLQGTTSSLAAVISHEAGVQNRQAGGFGSFSSITIRAASGEQTGVYLDGILLNNGGNPVIDFSTLEMLNLDSVDIYRGSSPMQLGHGAIGGAVNLKTLQSGAEPSTRLRLGVGSLSQRELSLSHQSRQGRWESAAAVSHRRSDNDFLFTNDNGTPLNPEDDRREKRNNASVTRTAALLRTAHRQHANARTDLTLQVADRELGVPEWRNNPDNMSDFATQTSQLQVSQVLDAIGNWNSRHSIFWHEDDARFRDTLSQVGLGAQDTDNQTRTLGAKTYWEYLADSATLGLSLEIRREDIDSVNRLDDSVNFDVRRLSGVGIIEYNWFNRGDTLSLTPAVRWQSSDVSGTRANSSQANDTTTKASRSGLQFGLLYRPSSHLTLTANAGSFYREPTFGELYGSIGLISGNPQLQAEEGLNIDAGIEWRRDSMRLIGTVFGSERNELIVTAFDAQGVGRPTNAGAARVIGLELSAFLTVLPRLDVHSNLTWQSPRSREKVDGFLDKLLPGEAQLAWFTRVQYQVLRTSMWYELEILKKRFYDRANLLPASNSQQHAIGLEWRNGRWTASIGIYNLGNDNIEDFNGFPRPGRTWALSVSRIL